MPDVTGITALDAGIGLAFVYLLFSVLCSAVQEAIAGVFGLRANTLDEGLRTLLDDHGAADENGAPLPVGTASNGQQTANHPPLSRRMLSHGLIRTQYRDAAPWSFKRDRRGPSYIPSKTFAQALLDIVEPTGPALYDDGSPQALVTRINDAQVPAGTKNALLALARDAGGNRERLRQGVEEWFDAAMDRVSGWYRRKAQLIICGLAVAVTVGFNVNTIVIADRLVRDDSVRAAVVEEATKASQAKLGPDRSLDRALEKVSTTPRLGLPIGWTEKDGGPLKLLENHFLSTTGGWLITIVMLSLGAPFWFGVLGRLVALRSSGAKPEPAKAP